MSDSSSPLPLPFSRRSLLGMTLALGGVALLGIKPAAARQSTPAGGDAWSDSILNRALVRGTLVTDETTMIATFADLERQTVATGVTRPPRGASDEEMREWLSAMFALALPGDYGPFVLHPEARAYAGFGIEEVSQTAEIGDPPGTVSLYQGTFDRDAVLNAWSEAAYSEVESGDVAIWSLSEDDSFAPTNPVQRLFLNRHNNAALIGDELIIFTSTLEGLRAAIAAATGEAASLAEHEVIAPVLAATPPLATGAIVPGSSIMTSFAAETVGEEDPDAIASAIADRMTEAQMPPVRIALIGLTGGGPYPSEATATSTGTPVPTPEMARIEIALLTYSAEEAAQAIEVAGERLETMESQRGGVPYRDLFASWDLSVADEAPVARLSLELGEAWPRIWSDMLYARDFGFIG